MRTSGRNIRGGLPLALVLVSCMAGVAAAETVVADAPNRDAYLVTATIVPGGCGAEVCGGIKGQGHVDLRIGFDADQGLVVNGVDAGTYDPESTYLIMADCHKVGGQWLVTTHIVNLTTGNTAFCQLDQAISGSGVDEFRAVAESVCQLTVG